MVLATMEEKVHQITQKSEQSSENYKSPTSFSRKLLLKCFSIISFRIKCFGQMLQNLIL